jgi:hypothetical protein
MLRAKKHDKYTELRPRGHHYNPGHDYEDAVTVQVNIARDTIDDAHRGLCDECSDKVTEHATRIEDALCNIHAAAGHAVDVLEQMHEDTSERRCALETQIERLRALCETLGATDRAVALALDGVCPCQAVRW